MNAPRLLTVLRLEPARAGWPEAGFHASYALLHIMAIVLSAAAVLHHGYLALDAARRHHPMNWSSDEY